jgi:hypothetical protein
MGTRPSYTGRRNAQFVTIRRGGRLDDPRHRLLAAWAADCAEHVLDHFCLQHSDDDRPRRAIEQARAWSLGEISVTQPFRRPARPAQPADAALPPGGCLPGLLHLRAEGQRPLQRRLPGCHAEKVQGSVIRRGTAGGSTPHTVRTNRRAQTAGAITAGAKCAARAASLPGIDRKSVV